MRPILTISIFLFALTLSSCRNIGLGGNHYRAYKIKFDSETKNDDIAILYQKTESTYLNNLKKQYSLDGLLNDNDTELERVIKILDWTNSRWEHSGMNSPKKNDAISILDEVKDGKQFPCFAYAIVLRDQLNANGLVARTIYLKTKNYETSKQPPGHVVSEVFLKKFNKWVFLDGQFGVMPILDSIPLNAVEFQKEITEENSNLELYGSDDQLKAPDYYSWIYPYLYYFDTSLDSRYNIVKQHTIGDKKALMLVPKGAKKISKSNFYKSKIDYCKYTYSILDFYAPPY